MKTIRKPAVAGMFYPAIKNKLEQDINEMLTLAQNDESFENVLGIVAPHAGYIYSGLTAAYAYNTIKDKDYRSVVIISPSHREYFPGISVYDGDAYNTPLGDVPINKEMSKKICDDTNFIFEGLNGHRAEHAVEVQIPFLQSLLSNFYIVPVVMGDQSIIYVEELAEKLAQVIDEKTLLVASSDLSHFYSKKKAKQLDSIIEKHIANFDYEILLQDLENHKCEACGGGAIATLMKTADMLNIKKSKVLSYTDSSDVTGDSSEVVGYLSAVIYN